jgi:antirestriction protein
MGGFDMSEKKKKTAIDVVIDSFIKRVQKDGVMPWQNPHKFGVSINWVSKKMYRGINRMILPSGEYMTKNQLNKYNEEHGTDFKFQKGIEWFPVVFYSEVTTQIKPEDIEFPLKDGESYQTSRGGTVFKKDGKYYTKFYVLKYSLVADICHFKDSEGNMLPRRIKEDGTGELVISKEDPERVIGNYLRRSGVRYEEVDDGRSFYNPSKDLVHVNKSYKWADAKYSVTFHELAHSTGHAERLNRIGVTMSDGFAGARYSEEECISEMTAALLCQETGISDFVTSGTLKETNSIAYVQNWAKSIRDFGSKLPSICKQAEQAYLYILGEDEDSQVNGGSTTER